MEIKEEWKNIEEYPDYMVSNMGNVKSLNYKRTREEKILKQNIVRGYCYVNLCKEGKPKHYQVHRLVAQAFLPNPQNLLEVNHKDENKQNNCVDNLEWCSHTYNVNYGTRNKKTSIAHKGLKHTQETKEKMSIAHKGVKLSQEHIEKCAKSRQKPILQFNREGTKIIGKYNSVSQASNELNIKCSNISSCLKGKLKSAGKYKWMYLEDYVKRMEKLYQMVLKKAS